MPLPFPHGTSSGQIGNGVQIDLNDAPGSTGGRFVGYAEDGKSSSNNRGLWALSVNIDYIYQNYTTPRAVPSTATFTSTGTAYRNLNTDVFVGTSDYPTSEAIGLPLLFVVLNERWAVLEDPTLGGEVRVTSIRDTGNVGTVYKGGDAQGFYTNVRLGFSLVDAPTGDVLVENYEIPADQVVNVIFGGKGTYESLSSDALLRTMIGRTGVPAGVLLQNGTRKMLANLDLNSYSLRNVYDLNGGSNQLAILDVNASSPVLFSEEVYGTALFSDNPGGHRHTSILGKINSATKGIGHSSPNRIVVKTGDLVFDGEAGTVTIPADNEYVILGETFTTGDDMTAQVPWDDQLYYVVIDHSGSLPVLDVVAAARMEFDLQPDMLVIASANASSTDPVFNWQQDLRTTGRHVNGRFEVTVGPDVQCDFTSLQAATEFVQANYLSLPTDAVSTWRPRIILRGISSVEVARQTVTFPLNSPFVWEIVGEGSGSGAVDTTITGQAVLYGAAGANTPTIDANGSTLHVKRVNFVPGSGTTTAGALTNLGDGSTFEEVTFATYLYGPSFDYGIEQAVGFSGSLFFKKCLFKSITTVGISTYGRGFFSDCVFDTVSSGGGWAAAVGGGGCFKRCLFSSAAEAYIGIGVNPADDSDSSFEVDSCEFSGVGLWVFYPTDTTSGRFVISNNTFENVDYNEGSTSAITGDSTAGSITLASSSKGATKVEITGNTFLGCPTSINFAMTSPESDNSSLLIKGNNIRQAYNTSTAMSKGVVLTDCGHITVEDNNIARCATGVSVSGSSHGTVKDNHFYNCTTRGVDVGAGTFPVYVRGNTFTQDAASASISIRVLSRSGCFVQDNVVTLVGGYYVTTGISIETAHYVTVSGNSICYTAGDSIYVSGSAGTRVTDNMLQGCASGYVVIHLLNSSVYRIIGNEIRALDSSDIPGGGIYVRRTTTGTAHGTISDNKLLKVQGHGNVAIASGSDTYVIYVESALSDTTFVGRTFIDRNLFNTCGSSSGGDSSTSIIIKVTGICQVTFNEIIAPQGSATGRTTLQAGIYIVAEAPLLWTSIVQGNQILISNAEGTSGGVCWYGTFYGIYMNQHGSVIGNNVSALNPVVGDELSSTRTSIKVADSRNVSDVGNVCHNVGNNTNLAQGITVGNMGETATAGNLTAHATGNATGA